MLRVSFHRFVWIIAAGLIVLSAPAQSQPSKWPNRPVTIVIPYPAGLTMDVIGRHLADHFSTKFGQPFVVDNRVGAVGTIGTRAVARSAPDGHTIVLGGAVALALSPMMFKDAGGFDPVKEIVPIVMIYKTPHVLVASHKSSIKTFPQLLAYAKENPGKLTVGIAAGIGSTAHMTIEMLLADAGGKATIVPYRASPPIGELTSGQIEVASVLIQDYAELLKANMVQGLAITSKARSPALPDLPTVESSGVPGFETTAWFALGGPVGTPSEAIQKINEATNEWLNLEKTRKLLESIHTLPVGGTPEDARAFIQAELAKWTPILKTLDLKF